MAGPRKGEKERSEYCTTLRTSPALYRLWSPADSKQEHDAAVRQVEGKTRSGQARWRPRKDRGTAFTGKDDSPRENRRSRRPGQFRRNRPLCRTSDCRLWNGGEEDSG